jgi:hypothetical protein
MDIVGGVMSDPHIEQCQTRLTEDARILRTRLSTLEFRNARLSGEVNSLRDIVMSNSETIATLTASLRDLELRQRNDNVDIRYGVIRRLYVLIAALVWASIVARGVGWL